MERGTGFEPATTSLEGWCSATELPPRVLVDFTSHPVSQLVTTVRLRRVRPNRARPRGESEWWAGRDSNPRRREPTDLQSAPFGRLGTCPFQGTRPWAIVANSLRRLPNARRLQCWSWRSDLHRQPPVYKTGALLLSYASLFRLRLPRDSRDGSLNGQAESGSRRASRKIDRPFWVGDFG